MKKGLKLFCVVLCVMICFSTYSMNSFANKNALLGDCNGDGLVNSADSLMLNKYIASLAVIENAENADVNCNQKITVVDLLNIKKFLAKIISSFAECFIGTNPLSTIECGEVHPISLGIVGARHYSDNNAKNIYARNIWDMQVFGDKVYLGLGNYSDNTGAAPVYYLYKNSKRATITNYLNSESVEKFFVIDNKMYAEATDPTPWLTGYFYELDEGRADWFTYSLMPNGVHCYDMVKFKDYIFFGGAFYKQNESGKEVNVGIVQRRSAMGLTDKLEVSYQVPFYSGGVLLDVGSMFRCYNLFVYKDELYAIHYGNLDSGGLYKYNDTDGGRFEQVQKANVIGGIYSVIENRYYTLKNETVISESWCKAINEMSDGRLVAICNDIFETDDLNTYKKVRLVQVMKTMLFATS